MTLSVDGGGAAGGNLPSPKNAAIQIARELAGRAGLTTLLDRATLMLNKPGEISYQDNRFGDGAESAVQNAAMLGKVTRTGSALIPNWNFRSGGKVGPLRVAADNELRWNEPPEDEYAGHPLIETGAGSNGVRNPRGEGGRLGVVGGAGAMPTYWGSSLTHSAYEIVSLGEYSGWPVAGFEISGGSNSDSEFLYFETTTEFDAVQNDIVTFWVVARVASGDFTGLDKIELQINEYDSGGSSTTNSTVGSSNVDMIAKGLDGDLRAFVMTYTVQHASTAHIQPLLRQRSAASNASSIALGLEVGAPQIAIVGEAGSPILPPSGTLAVSTRGAETRNGGFQCERDGRAIGFEWDGTNGGVISPAREYYKHSPVSEGCIAKGMPATTNKIRNPNFIGGTAGVMGSGGVAPTNMTLDTHAGSEIVGFGQEGIARYMDVRINGTPTTNIYLALEPGTQVALVDGDDATQSTGVRLVNGSFAAFSAIRTYIQTRTGAGAAVGAICTNDFTPDYRSRYFTKSEAVSGGTIAYGQPYLVFYNPDGVTACDFTIRIYLPMMEKTSFASMPVLPPPGTTGEASRILQVPKIGVGSVSDFIEFTVVADVIIPLGDATGFAWTIFAIGNGSSTDDYVYLRQTATGWNLAVREGGAFTVGSTLAHTFVPGERKRFAIRFKTNDFRLVVEGIATVLNDTTGLTPDPAILTDAFFTNRASGAAADSYSWPGTILAFDILPYAASNDELTALVGNS